MGAGRAGVCRFRRIPVRMVRVSEAQDGFDEAAGGSRRGAAAGPPKPHAGVRERVRVVVVAAARGGVRDAWG